MRHFPFPIAMCAGFAAVVAASLATPTPARAQDVPTVSQQVAANHVWTNQDMDRLRAEGLISTFSPAIGAPAPERAQAPEAVPMPQRGGRPAQRSPRRHGSESPPAGC